MLEGMALFSPLLTQVPAVVALIAAFVSISCAPTATPSTSTSCSANTALIAVHDLALMAACGCNETPGTWVTDNSLTCTIRSSSAVAVVFNFVGRSQPHQLLVDNATGSKDLSPVYGPGPSTTSYSVIFGAPGTYRVTDAFNGRLGATIVVQ